MLYLTIKKESMILNGIRVKFFLAGLLVLLLTASGQELTVRIIQTTDLHGSVDHGTLARTATLVEQETQAAGGPEKSLRIDCGDLIQGSYAMTFPEGRELMIRFLDQLSYDVFVPGNHDFEFGSAVLLPLIRQFRGSVLGMNLEWPDAPVRSWKMFRRNQLNIAVIGIAYPSLDRMFVPQVLGTVRPLPVEKQLEKVIPEVMRARPDLILLAMHAGEQSRLGPDLSCFDLVRKYPQIDLILCGHSHQAEPGKMIGKNTWLLQAPPHAVGIGTAVIRFDRKQRRIISLTTHLARIDGVREHPEIKKQIKQLNGKTFRTGRRKVADLPVELRPLEKNEFSNFLTGLNGKAIMQATGAEIVFYGVNSRFRTGPGILSEYQLFRLMPYDDHVLTVDLTAGEIRRILAEQIALRRKNNRYQAPTGLHFTLSRRELQQIILDRTGKPLENGRTYRTAFSSYIFAGGGRCPQLHSIVKNKQAVFFPVSVRKMTADHLRGNYPVRPKEGNGK